MRIRTIAGAGTAAIIIAAGTALIPLAASAQPATPAASSHTYKFTSINQKEVDGSNSAADADNDYVQGKLTGFDTDYGTYNTQTKKLDVDVTVTTTSGILYGYATGALGSTTFHGTVTGGVGAYKNAKGTFTATNLNKSGTKTAITITYTVPAS